MVQRTTLPGLLPVLVPPLLMLPATNCTSLGMVLLIWNSVNASGPFL
jgi:hypothetical protein